MILIKGLTPLFSVKSIPKRALLNVSEKKVIKKPRTIIKIYRAYKFIPPLMKDLMKIYESYA